MNTFEHLETIIKNRRAVFPPLFEEGTIPEEQIWKILEMANWAPSHKKTEPWRFVVLRDKALIRFGIHLAQLYKETMPTEKFSEIKYRKIGNKIAQSDCVIAICMKRHEDSGLPEWEEEAAVACAVQNLWLSASALGLGGYWSSPKFLLSNSGFFELAHDEKCMGIFYLGKATDQNKPSVRGDIKEKVRWLEQ